MKLTKISWTLIKITEIRVACLRNQTKLLTWETKMMDPQPQTAVKRLIKAVLLMMMLMKTLKTASMKKKRTSNLTKTQWLEKLFKVYHRTKILVLFKRTKLALMTLRSRRETRMLKKITNLNS